MLLIFYFTKYLQCYLWFQDSYTLLIYQKMYLEISYWEITFSSFLVKKKNLKNLHASLHQCFHINFQFSILFELYLLHSAFYEFSYCFCIIYSGMYKDMYIFIILVLSHCYDILTGDFLLSESWKSQQFNSLYLRYKCCIFQNCEAYG